MTERRPEPRSDRRSPSNRTGPRRPQRRPAPKRRSLLGFLFKWASVAAIWGGVILLGLLGFYAYDLPDIRQVAELKRRPSITLIAEDGSTIARYGDLYGVTVNAADLPPHLIQAVLAVEDRRFYSHFGVDPFGLARAAVANWRAGTVVQGGSTITQQLAKNLFLTPERTMRRKIQEALLALWMERRYTKNQILSAYFNRVYLGAGTYGVDAAARTYFGKPATQVDLYEAAVLAGLLKAPSRYSPTSNPDEAQARAEVVLAAMVDAGFLAQADVTALRRAPPTPRRKPGPAGDGRYFADWIVDQVSDFIGYENVDLVVRTTVSPRLQQLAEARLATALSGPAVQAGATQAALVVLSTDGAVRAMVGGRDHDESQFNRATQALRQPGSAFKPFVYLAALEAGLGPDTRILDAPLDIGGWRPANFDMNYRGEISLRDALAYSVNTSAVRLLDRVGVDEVRMLARRLGVNAPLSRDLGLALGTSEVTLIELTGAYAAFANGGTAVWPYAITEIQDRQGRVLYRRQGSGGVPAVDEAVIGRLNGMLMAAVEYGTAKGARLDRPVAGKTGTSQDYRDAWFIGYSADYVTGVWFGNDDNSRMARVTGGGLPTTLWREVMADIHAGLPARPLPGLDAAPQPPAVAVAGGGADAGPLSDVPILGQFRGLLQRLTGRTDVQYDYPTGD